MNHLSTGELAQLFNLSKYTIRYYIDKGLLTPKQNPANGYYFFNEADVYKLYQIVVFRNIGYSIKEIKASLSAPNNIATLKNAETALQEQIDELTAIKETVGNILSAQKKYRLDEFVFFERGERCFQQLPAAFIKQESPDLLTMVKNDVVQPDELFYVQSDQVPVPCFRSDPSNADFIFPAGTYACKSFAVKDEADVTTATEQFLADPLFFQRDSSKLQLLLYENILCALAYNDITVYTLEVHL
ncbi:MerR family transcriptional regulator [Enterococcus sp. UD-01]|jgi:DNA-binding transcriptional MerR regulator|uniref:MerR family transcriptional regulator n=1 Tax=Enterococcus sp. UD-01 TaxID=3373911 RepID=UPI0038382B0E